MSTIASSWGNDIKVRVLVVSNMHHSSDDMRVSNNQVSPAIAAICQFQVSIVVDWGFTSLSQAVELKLGSGSRQSDSRLS